MTTSGGGEGYEAMTTGGSGHGYESTTTGGGDGYEAPKPPSPAPYLVNIPTSL